ncbi:MAG: TIGR03936 family radical SAM-associated protein [Ruminococcus sp.]|jgi:radical SAM-linked protein|nr:TIGR03936 family radical SAM-associated protein [Ruminococcus sp.]
MNNPVDISQRKFFRAKFSKTKEAVFISHLDLVRCLTRCFRRADLPLWYTQGFTPRVYLNFPLPLSLGVEGEREFFDFAVIAEKSAVEISAAEIRERLNEKLPDGLHIIDVYEPQNAVADIKSAAYEISANGDITKQFEEFINQERILSKKHTKSKGMVEIDIKPYINLQKITFETLKTYIKIILPSGSTLNINAGVFVNALAEFCGVSPENFYSKRTEIFTEDGHEFV